MQKCMREYICNYFYTDAKNKIFKFTLIEDLSRDMDYRNRGRDDDGWKEGQGSPSSQHD